MKKIVSLASIVSAAAAFAAPEPQLNVVTFATTEPALYADGTQVADGECFAIVWSSDGVFEGIKVDGSPIDAKDRVLWVDPCAKDGMGAMTLQVRDDVAFGGVLAADGAYAFLALDTRKFNGTTDAAGKPVFTVGKANPLNATVAVAEAEKSVSKFAAATGSTVGKQSVPTALPAEIQPPKITNIIVGTDTVTLEVDNTSPLVNYGVSASQAMTGFSAVGVPQAGNGGKIVMIVPKPGDGGFFQVNRK